MFSPSIREEPLTTLLKKKKGHKAKDRKPHRGGRFLFVEMKAIAVLPWCSKKKKRRTVIGIGGEKLSALWTLKRGRREKKKHLDGKRGGGDGSSTEREKKKIETSLSKRKKGTSRAVRAGRRGVGQRKKSK